MFKLLVERGMIDEAAKEIHDANLGSTLKRLAMHVTGAQPISLNVKQKREGEQTVP